MTRIVSDAHPILWMLAAPHLLPEYAREVLHDPSIQVIVPVIALLEAVRIIDKGRVPVDRRKLVELVTEDASISLQPISIETAMRSMNLGPLGITELHDQLIVATCLELGDADGPVPLITMDREITAAGVVPVIWN